MSPRSSPSTKTTAIVPCCTTADGKRFTASRPTATSSTSATGVKVLAVVVEAKETLVVAVVVVAAEDVVVVVSLSFKIQST